MRYKSILITGGAGFIGSNLAIRFKEKYPGLNVIALDNLKRRGSELNLGRLKRYGISFLHGDIRCPEDLVLGNKVDLIIESSAEPSILAGYGENPLYILNTNLSGTINCLELARKKKADLIFLSTSRVYPYKNINAIKTLELPSRFAWREDQEIAGWSEEGIGEGFNLEGPKTLYGATKLASELILQEYIANYKIRGVINRCGVVAGPWQFGKVDQGIFAYWMMAHYFNRNLNYIGFGGAGKQVRDLLHVDDLFSLIDKQAANLAKISGTVYNAGGGRENSLSLRETTELCQKISGKRIKIGSVKETRPGDVAIYITDNTKVYRELGWEPKIGPRKALQDIYASLKEHAAEIKGALL